MSALTVSNYLGMLQDDPNNAEAYEGLKDAIASGDPARMGEKPLRLIEMARGTHERRGEHQANAWLIDLEVQMSDDDPRFQFSLLKELGRVLNEELMRGKDAVEAYQLAMTLREDDDLEEKIEQIEGAVENWRQIADRFISEAEDASDPSLKASMYMSAGSLVWQHRKKGRAKEVDQLFGSALEAEPGNTRAARLFAQTLRARNKHAMLGDTLMNTADHARNRDEKISMYIHAGRVFVRELEDLDKAAQCYERVLDFTPGQDEALAFLVEYFTERELWDHLVALYEDALRSRQKLESEQGILLQIAMVQWRIRNVPDEAEPYFARLRKIDPSNPGMLSFYREYLPGRDDARLVTILSDAQRLADESQKLELATEMARSAQASDQTERAIDAWKAVQRMDPAHAEAGSALRDLYRKGEKWNALVEVMRAEVDALPAAGSEDATDETKARKLGLLRELVPIYREHLKLDVMVINTYNAILAEAPGDGEAVEQLAATYESMGRWNDLIRVLSQKADASEDAAQRVELYSRVAGLWIDRFANYNQATGPLEKVLEIDPENRSALSQLKDIYAKKRAWGALYHVLEKEGDLASDPEARLAGKIELAKLAGERLHKHADAIALWKSVLAEAPDTPGALDALEKLADREKDWDTVAEVIERRIGEAQDDKQKIKLLTKLGGVHSDRREDPASAARAWQRVLQIEPKNGRALRTLREAFIGSGDIDGLEALYAEASDWEGLAEVLGNSADKASDPEFKKVLSLRAAKIYEEQIGEPQRAFRNYERVLSVDPQNVQAATALCAIYEKDEKWPRLVAMQEVLLQQLPESAEPEERLTLLERLRSISLDKLSDGPAAFGFASQAYALDPSNPTVIEGLEAAAEDAGTHEELVQLYQRRVAAEDVGAEERTSLRRRIAAVAGEKLGQSEQAIDQLREVLSNNPEDADAIAVLDRLYRAEGRVSDLRDLFDHRLERTADPADRWVLLAEVAELEETQLEQPDAASARYRQILEIEPLEPDALRGLDRLSYDAERWEELADVLGRRREISSDPEEGSALALRHGDVLRKHLGDARGAMDAYGEALRLEPASEGALSGLEVIAAATPAGAADTDADTDTDTNTDAAEGDAEGAGQRAADKASLAIEAGRLLEPAYTRRGEFGKVSALLRQRLELTEDEDEKRALRLRLAELAATELGDPEGAYKSLEAAFLDRPGDAELWDRLAGAAEQAGKHEALAQAYSMGIEAGDLTEQDITELSRRAAELYDIILDDPASAEPFHKRVLRDDPLSDRAFVALKELYTNTERWDDLQALYRNRIAETVDGEHKRELLLQVCFVFEELLEDYEKAIQYYEEVLELTPDHVPSRRALDRLYRSAERWRDLAALRQEDLNRADGHEILDITFELGELHELRLDQASQAVDYYEQVLTESPTHLRAQEALERLIGEPQERQRIATLLEPLYDAQGAWPELARVLEVQLEDVRDAAASLPLLARIGDIYERFIHDNDKAFNAHARAVAADPADPTAREELARLAAVRGAQRERAAVLEAAVEASSEPYLQSELLMELGTLWDEVGAAPDSEDGAAAERAYTRLIEVDGDNPDAVLPASRALERIHLMKGNYPALAEDLRRQVKFESDPEVRGGLLTRLAELLETTLDDTDGAIAAHRDRLDNNPDEIGAMTSLERLYERKGAWQELVGVLQARDGAVADEETQLMVSRRIGEVYATQLNDADNAIVAYNDVISRFGPDAQSMNALVALYTAGGKWDDLLEVREMQLSSTEVPTERAELRFESAELMRTKTQQVERAIEAYRDVLEQLPGHPGTVNALEEIITDPDSYMRVEAGRVLVPHYRGQGQYAELISALEVVAESDDPLERLESLTTAAEVAEVGLESADRAFELQARAVRVGATEDDVTPLLANFARLAEASGQWQNYVDTLKTVSQDILDAEVQGGVMMTVAATAHERLDDADTAATFYARVLENQPDHRPALDALEALQTAAGDHRALLGTIKRKAEIAEDPDDRVELMLQQARICETHLDNTRSAIDAYENVLMEDGRRAEAYAGLERLYTAEERYDDLRSLLERQLDAGVGDLVDVRYRLGRVSQLHLDDMYSALDQYKEALALNGDHEPSIEALQSLLSAEESEHQSLAAEILEPVYLRRLDWANVARALRARLATETDMEVRKELFGRMGTLHEDYLEDLDGALEVYAQLFDEDPRSRDVWDTLTRLTNVLEKWPRLAQIYSTALERERVEDEDTAELAAITARIYDERTGQPAKAAPFYAQALDYDPTRADLFSALESVYQRSEEWQPLVELYRRRLDVAESDEERVAVLHRMAETHEVKLESVPNAIETYREVLENSPGDSGAIEALDRLLGATGQHHDLADHLRYRIDNAMGTAAEADLRHRLGVLQAGELDDIEGAIDSFEEVLQNTPDHAPTVQALEGLVMNEDHQLRITQMLEPIYREQDEWRKLVAVLEAQAGLANDPSESQRLLGEVAVLHEERGQDQAMAFDAWSRAFLAEPREDAARGELDRLAESLDAWDGVVTAYETAVGASDDPALQSELLGIIARVHDERRGDPRAAIKTYERLAEHDPDDTSSLDMLEALHTMVGDWSGMVDVLNQKTERSYDPIERAELLRRSGSVLEELLGEPAKAIEAYTRASEEDAEDPIALEALDRLYLQSDAFESLSRVLARRMEVEQEPALQTELGLRLAQLEETQLNRPDAAIDALNQVLAIQDGHPDAVVGLARLYERQAMWPELLDTLRLQAEQAPTPTQKVAFIHRGGAVLERELDDVLEAIEMYRQALEIDEGHDPSLEALTRITALEDYREQAADILEPLLRVQGKHDGLANLLQLRAEGATDPFDRKEYLRQLASVHEEGRQDQGAAFEALSLALAEDATDITVQDDLERLAASLGTWGPLADTFGTRAGAVMDPDVAKGLWVRFARIAEAHLNDDHRAVMGYQRAMEQVGDDPELLLALDGLHVKTENWGALGDILDRRVSMADAPEQRTELLLRLGELRQTQFQDLRGAFASFQEVVEVDPSNERALAALHTLTDNPELAVDAVDVLDNAYRNEGRSDKVLELYDVRIRLADTNGERVRLLQEAAELWEHELGQPDRALGSMRQAFELEPRDLALLDEVERLAEASGDWESLRGMVERAFENPDADLDTMGARDLNLRAAAWYGQRLGDPEQTEIRLRAAIELDPECLEAHEKLIDVLRGRGDVAALIPALRAWAAVDTDELAVKTRLREAASLSTEAGDIETAAACHDSILRVDPNDPDALDALAEIRTVQEQWPAVVELLQRRIDGEADVQSRMSLRRRVAEIYAGPISDPGRAIDAYVALLDEDPTSLATIEALEGLYQGAERWDDLRDLLDRRLDLAETTQDQIAARVRLARLDEQAFGRRADAMEQLRGILELDPINAEALDELERLMGLEGQWDDLAELLEKRATDAPNDEGRIAALRRLATVHADQRNDAEAAVEVYSRVVALAPEDEASLRALVALREASGNHAATADALERLLPVLGAEESVLVLHRVATLAEENLDDTERAEMALRQALAIDEGEGSREALREHLKRHQKHAALAELLAEQAEALPEAERVDLYKTIASIYTDKLDDPASGAGYLERAAELVPEDREVLLPLCDLYIAAGRQGDAVPVLEQIIASFGRRRSKELAQYHHRLGRALHGMGNVDGALEHYDSAFKIDLTNVQILRDLGYLTHERGDYDRAQKTFRALLLQKLKPDSGITKADVYFYLGDISHRQGNASKAKSMLDRAVAEDKSHERAQALLAELKG